ncbi:azaleucine resistance protein AzlC [Bacillus thuringiensis]|uniref:azaleucine resistance protein AzlC n=1 Tax=Bacillus TaxID=1386 RepID=UPI000A399E38|nr:MULTISPECIES: azaleucine resistance protein AzlC [Bacillus cereus group]MCC2543387.1 azaleucine resistance protein AzlC [Bacillus thuringiensis]MCU4777104.1 azaleucine resistance protein AzlC [Bacillus cereus]MCU4807738.1 azaleucine resistance protein AzlC [Bacillus cereus]MCU5143765.1 azaleucine resistance protein AzlC [Bacillus cereus]MEC2709784.1 azaleucine resistance protein AzlC [Bacillus thuringiensis]
MDKDVNDLKNSKQIKIAFLAAFPYTAPILAGFVFLGIAYGIYMNSLGFSAIYPFIMSFAIFAGSMEFIAANLLLVTFDPINALFLTLTVNARHLFYGISMLDKYKGTGRKKFYLIYGLCDESFSINSTVDIPKNVDKGWFMTFVTLLNHSYWVLGATIGGIFGSLVQFNTKGLEFVMTALFVVIFIEQWMEQKKHHSALIGLILSISSLIIFGGNNFIIPAMIMIVAMLTVLKKPIEKEKKASA